MVQRHRFAQITLTGIFLLTLALFFFGTILSPKRELSLQEKRPLVKSLNISWTMDGMKNLPKTVDTYLNDHFFHREDLVFFNALPRVIFLHKSPTFVALVGEDGWYYFSGDWAIHDYLGNFAENTDALRAWEALITLRQQRLQAMGGDYLVAVVPNKESAYPEFLPRRFIGKRGTPMLDALAKTMRDSPMAEHFIDLSGPLQQAKATGRTYYKIDSHWNDRGAYFSYLALMERMRRWHPEIVPLPEERFDKQSIAKSARSDIACLMGLLGAITETDEVWSIRQPCAAPEDRPLLSADIPPGRPLTTNGCPTGAPVRLLVISDSFGEGLNKYLSETFREVIYSRELGVADLRPYLAKHPADIVLDLRVGRYIPKVMSPGPDETPSP